MSANGDEMIDLIYRLAAAGHVEDAQAADLCTAIARSMRPVTTSLRMRLGPPPNELDAVRAQHRRMDVATPDDHVDVLCATCYFLDEGWPCTVARLVEVIDAQIADEEAALQAIEAVRR